MTSFKTDAEALQSELIRVMTWLHWYDESAYVDSEWIKDLLAGKEAPKEINYFRIPTKKMLTKKKLKKIDEKPNS